MNDRLPDDLPTTRAAARRLIAALALGAAALAACDTGDGKTLRPPSETLVTTVAPVPTLNSVPLDDGATLPAGGSETPAPTAPPQFQVFAPWIDGAPIEVRYSCDGEDVAPAVSWVSPPPGAAEIAIALIDESATAGEGPFVHWVIAGLDPAAISLLEGDAPLGAVQATNSFGEIGYGGPCPPPGDEAHVYRLTVYALNQQAELADGTDATEYLDFIEEVAIGAADLTGTFRR